MSSYNVLTEDIDLQRENKRPYSSIQSIKKEDNLKVNLEVNLGGNLEFNINKFKHKEVIIIIITNQRIKLVF